MLVTILDPSLVRTRVLAEHGELRALLDDVEHLATLAAANRRALPALRARARNLYRKFASHIDLEDCILAPALREVVGWGAMLSARLAEEHRRQREQLRHAIALIESDEASGTRVIASIRRFSRALASDMKEEEDEILRSDLLHDHVFADGESG